MRPTTAFDDNVFDINALLHPGTVFDHPKDVLAHHSLSVSEKRAILASWASDCFGANPGANRHSNAAHHSKRRPDDTLADSRTSMVRIRHNRPAHIRRSNRIPPRSHTRLTRCHRLPHPRSIRAQVQDQSTGLGWCGRDNRAGSQRGGCRHNQRYFLHDPFLCSISSHSLTSAGGKGCRIFVTVASCGRIVIS